MVGEEEGRRPWRNPDPRPTDTHYSYRESPYLPLYSRLARVYSMLPIQDSLSILRDTIRHFTVLFRFVV